MDVRVHDYAFILLEPRAQHYVGGFARHSGQGQKLVHLIGNLAAEITHDLLRRADHGFRFVAEEAGRANIGLELFGLERGKILNRRIFPEQLGRNHIHANVGRLGGKDGRDQQLPRALVMQGAGDVGIETCRAA